MDFATFAPVADDASAPYDGAVPLPDTGSPQPDVASNDSTTGIDAGMDAGADAGSANDAGDGGATDSGTDSGCNGVLCGSTCQSDFSACTACNGGTDFVVCDVCADGGAPSLVCSPADQSAFCLNGMYSHCPCTIDSQCPDNTMRCTMNQCATCGEPLFDMNHNRCQMTGRCCKSGATVGKCAC